MNLKQKSILIYVGTFFFFVLVMEFLLNFVMLGQLQKIEDQRVERNIRRLEAILQDQFIQISNKLVDWSNWDDTYEYISDKNEAYEISNLADNTFEALKIDEVLFINKDGFLLNGVDNIGKIKKTDSPNEIYNNFFATGSALLKLDKDSNSKQGLIKTNDGVLMFVIRDILRSGGGGISNGKIVFGKYLNTESLETFKELTQFEVSMTLWSDPKMSTDILAAKENYLSKNENKMIKNLDDQTISGYLIVEDINKDPQLIIRSDIKRDVFLQGINNVRFLTIVLVVAGIVIILISYLTITKLIFKKILLIDKEITEITKEGDKNKRLNVDQGGDEANKLRQKINEMLDSIKESQAKLTLEKQKGDSLIDLINTIVLMIDKEGNVKLINKKGLEMLGYVKEEVIGKNWLENFLPKQVKETVISKFNKILSGDLDENAYAENEVLKKDGKTILVGWHTTVVNDEAGKIIATLSIGDDITVKKKEEVKREEYAKDLEKINQVMVDRELRMVQLKQEINDLKNKLVKIE